MPDTYTSQFSGEEIDAVLRAVQILSGASTPAELRKKLEIRGDTIPVSAEDSTLISEALTKIPTTSGGGINPNLLDNWYFGRPVNQRGQTEYSGNATYSIDRWWTQYETTLSIVDGGIKIGGKWDVQQYFENTLPNATYTLSLLYKDRTGSDPLRLLLGNRTDGDLAQTESKDASGILSITFSTAKLNKVNFGFTGSTDNSAIIIAIKLELGDTQTLAHKENGVWVLNEIPDFGEQLRRCQRYCKVFPKGSDLPVLAFAQPEKWYLSAFIPFDDMRTVPAHNIGSGIKCHIFSIDSDEVSASETILNWGATPTGQKLRLSDNSVSSADFPFRINLDADLIFSADL